MKTAYDYLTAEVNPEEITKVTLNELEFDVKKTLELMKETDIDVLFDDLVFWTKNARYDRAIEYDHYGDKTIYFQERKIKQKTKKKIVPDSLVEMWTDPVTQERLPFKTKAYLKEEEKYRIQTKKEEIKYRKEKFQELKDRVNEYIRLSEKSKIEPLTIIVGGRNDVCRYITLPQSFPMPKSSTFYLRLEDFYKNMNKDIFYYIDFAGIAGVMDGKLQPLFRFGESTLAMFIESERNEIKRLINNAIKDGKFAIVVGISEVSAGALDVGMAAEKVVEEFKKYI